MNLISTQVQPPAQIIAQRIDQTRSFALQGLVRATKSAFNDFWNSNQATPQQIVDIFGTSAKTIFENHAATVQFILSVDPSALQPSDYTPQYNFTINSNGTVTIGSKK